MKLKIVCAGSLALVIVLLVYSQTRQRRLDLASDFPRENVIFYVQISDAAQLVKIWNESSLRENYLKSANFDDFADSHLGRKLASRWSEFSEAAGFALDAEVIGSFGKSPAAIAVYDVGKLDFVLIAPVSDEIVAATRFPSSRDKFTEQTLPDGTTAYQVSVAADRGRQPQKLIFAQIKGRFVLATNEKNFLLALANINGANGANRLTDEPLFKILNGKIAAHDATVWVNQTALNADYYFKRYWLMSRAEDLKEMRAGLFDFEIRAEKIVERRRILCAPSAAAPAAPMEDALIEQISRFLPQEMPFYQLRSIGAQSVGGEIEKLFSARSAPPAESETSRAASVYYSADDDFSSSDYEYLGRKFEEKIDDADDDSPRVARVAAPIDWRQIFEPAQPAAILSFAQPASLPVPKFAEFRRAVVIHLAQPDNFDRRRFENAVSRRFAAAVLIAAPSAEFEWRSANENFGARRELSLPMIGRALNYAVIGNELIVADDAEFFRFITNERRAAPLNSEHDRLTSLIIVKPKAGRQSYDEIFGKLNENDASDLFFTANIASLLDVFSQVETISIKQNRNQDTLEEEISFDFSALDR